MPELMPAVASRAAQPEEALGNCARRTFRSEIRKLHAERRVSVATPTERNLHDAAFLASYQSVTFCEHRAAVPGVYRFPGHTGLLFRLCQEYASPCAELTLGIHPPGL